jgi:tRNA 2-thiouridine synthesizing protein A
MQKMRSSIIEVKLDTSGLLCPYPLAKAKSVLSKMQVGEVLRVISTDPASVIDFKVFVEVSEYSLLESHQEKGKFIFVIQK